ncbi:MAG: hypothetical protein ACREOO_30720 [bacterium]
MSDRDQVKQFRQEAAALHDGAEDSAPGALPAAIQTIIDQNWETLRPTLEKEELLTALECFSQYMYHQQPVLPSPDPVFVAQPWWEMIRRFFERTELVRMLYTTDEEIRYRYELFAGLFEQAFRELDARQRQIVRLSASAVYSAAEIASAMHFSSVAKMLVFQRSAFRMIAKALCLILRSELKKAEMETRRRAVITEWLEWFANRAGVCFAAFLWGMLTQGS